jgi:hypothetical protein
MNSLAKKTNVHQKTNDPILPPNPENMDIGELIKDEVLNRLGTPPNLLQITAGNVYDNRWRVNVWVNKDVKTDYSLVKTPSIPDGHSFFCIVKQGAEIVFITPIKKLY